MKSFLCAGALALGVFFGGSACAQEIIANIVSPVSGYTYFNRPGATMADQRADLEACHPSVMAMEQPLQSSGAGAAYGLVGVIVEVSIDSAFQQVAQRRARVPLYENCMVLRGWRVIRLDEALGEELDALDQPALALRLEPLVGAETPAGEIARVFANEIANPSALLFGSPPQSGFEPLSLQALPPDNIAAPPRPPTPEERNAQRRRPGSGAMTREQYDELLAARQGTDMTPEARQARREARSRAQAELLGPGDAAREVRARDVARLSDGSTLLVVRVAGRSYTSGVILMRPGAQEDTVDAVIAVVPTAIISGRKEATVIAVAPPGRWRLSGFVGGEGFVTSLCMGAPTFDIAEGDVVFAGTFNFDPPWGNGATEPRLNMSLEPAQAALAQAPTLAARVRPAAYRNGDTFECGAASGFYSYEIADAPFEDGYRFGSRAHLAHVAPSPGMIVAPEPQNLP